MAQNVSIPWGAWYLEDEVHTLEFPEGWDISLFDMEDAKDITHKDAIDQALKDPVGTSSVEQLAQGKHEAVIVVEDISRPTMCASICEGVVNLLNRAGISDERITILTALGAHRPMTRADLVKKVGQEIVWRIKIENHNPYENLVHVGESKSGTPIYLNKTYRDAGLKIAIGTVVPHILAGFGGGAKIILPGICGMDTLEANHRAVQKGIGVGIGYVTELREDIEDVCGQVTLDFSINIVSTSKRGIAAIYAGDYVKAHRLAMEKCKKVYRISPGLPAPEEKAVFDIGFFNLYPEDLELFQSVKGLNIFMTTYPHFKPEASLVFTTAATEGRGWHGLFGETGAPLRMNFGDTPIFKQFVGHRELVIYSPNVNQADVLHIYPERTVLKNDFVGVVEHLEKIHGSSPRAAIFSNSIQLAA
jgi:nickel-dependent lactate racemase